MGQLFESKVVTIYLCRTLEVGSNLWVICWYLYALAYIHIIIGPLLEGEWGSWPIYGKIVQLN